MYRRFKVVFILLVMLMVNHCLKGQILPVEASVLQKAVSKEDSLRIKTLIEVANDSAAMNPAAGWKLYTEAERQSIAVGSPYLYGDVLLQEAVLYYRESKHESAIEACRVAASYFKESGATLKEVRCYSNLGLLYQFVGNYNLALESLFKGLRLAKDKPGNSDVVGGLYTNLSNAYNDLSDFENALKYGLKAEQINLEDKDTADLGAVYNTIALIYNAMHKPRQAIASYKKAIQYHRLAGEQRAALVSTGNLAEVYLTLEDIDSALYYQRMVAEYTGAHKNEGFREYCFAIAVYGYMLSASGKAGEATKYLSGCLSCKPMLADYNFAQNYYSFLYQYYKSTGRTDLALENMEKLNEVKDSVNVASRRFENQRIALKYEFDARAKEDSLSYQLRISGQEVKAATYRNRMYLLLVALLVISIGAVAVIRQVRKVQLSKRMADMDVMRSTIAGDLHDDIGSTLSSIQIISSLALRQCDTNTELKKSVSQISSLSDKVSDGIREIVWSVNPAHDRLTSVIQLMRKLAAELLSPNEITFRFRERIKDGELLISPQLRKDFLMIFKEAVNNARKYSGTGQVDIDLHQTATQIKLLIIDYGKGFDMEKVLRGNGLDNMQRRADAMKAELTIVSVLGKGTRIILEVPLP